MSKVKIAINRHHIDWNKKHPDEKSKPVVSVKYSNGKPVDYTNEVTITGTVKILYKLKQPLGCGATVWIEAMSEDIHVVSPMSYEDTKANH